MDLPSSFGYWVRRRRKALDLTQAELARRVGCAEVTIQKIETDERRPSYQIAELLAEHLRIPPAERTNFLASARAELAVDRLPVPTADGDRILERPANTAARGTPVVRPPSGTVTFLFTDIEGSTRLWEQYPALMPAAFQRQETILRQAIGAYGGYAYKMIGDAFQAAFATAAAALAAALAAQQTLVVQDWGPIGPVRVRMALDSGVVEERGDDYVGPLLNRTARLLATGYGGQILLSAAAHELVWNQLPPHVSLRDLGIHQLKDITRPEHVFQVVAPDLPSDFPPLKTKPPATAPTRRSNLPTQPTPLVGRVRELADLTRLLDDPHIRLITISGPGGMGKTRLAVALAEQVFTTERYLDGVYFVALAPLSAPEQIVPALAEALDFPLDTGKQRVRSPRQQVIDYLREKQLLLILDNVEHLLDDADEGAGAADLIAALLAAAARVAILATSRERLKLREEHLYPLGGLDMPGTEAPSSYSAVALFVQRARPLRPDFVPEPDDLSVVAQICRLVDGMPLAIELAAGWVDTLTLPDIAAEIARGLDLLATELRDVPARHRSMRAVFTASWHRLGAADQPVFARLAVFRGGGTRVAVQAVTWATLPQLHALVGASLLHCDAEHDRYTIHELLRQYAAEQLAAERQDDLATRDRHAAYYCAFLAERTEVLKGAGQEAALRAIEAEIANLHGALAWAGVHGAVALVDQALESLGYFYQWRGRYDEGLATFAAVASALSDAPAPDALRVQAHTLAWKAVFACLLGQLAQAEDSLQIALALLDAPAMAGVDTRAERAFALLQLGDLGHSPRVNIEAIQPHYTASLALYIELERPWEQSCALLGLGVIARWRGDYDLARGHLSACRAIREAAGDRRGLAEALNHESQAAVASGATDEALELARRSHAIYEELGEAAGRASGLGRLGIIQGWVGLFPEAQRTLAASRALYDDLGDELMVADDDGILAYTTCAVGDLEGAWALATQAIDRFRAVLGGDDPHTLWVGGTIALMQGNLGEAARLLRASVELSKQLGVRGLVGWAHSLLASTHWLLGRQAEARADLLAVLRAATTLPDVMSLLHALLAMTLIFAEEGAPERALELYAVARRHPMIGNHQAFTTFFGQRLDAASTFLPPEVAQAAQARGRERDLWATAHELLAELEAAGWGTGAAEA